jgi:hypothetical protein
MDLQESVVKFTAAPGNVDPASVVVTDVVVIEEGTPVSRGFERARTLLEEGRTVRLVGDSVTFPQSWPAWVRSSRGLLLTESGGYCTADMASTADAVRTGITDWLETLFSGSLPGFSARMFYGDALLRMFYRNTFFVPMITNIVRHEGARRYHYVGAESFALEYLRAEAESAGGALQAPRRRRSWIWPLKAGLFGLGMLAAVLLDQTLQYAAEGRSRKRLRQLRLEQKGRHPRLWACMTPDWLRGNRHIVESVVRPALAYGEPVGVLMHGKLIPGLRHEFHMRRHVGRELWPALGPVLGNLDRCVIEQVGRAESLGEFLTAAALTCRGSLRAIMRIAANSSYLDFGALHFNLADVLPATMKFVTQDMFNAIMGHRAVRAAVRRQNFIGSYAVISGPLMAASVLLLNDELLKAGARTVDFGHGTMGNRFSIRHEVCSIRCLWTDAERKTYDDSRSDAVAGMPRNIARNKREPGHKAQRILFLTNYVHRDDRMGSRFPLKPYLEEILSCITLIRNEFGDRFQFRWRPHPADSEEEIMQTLANWEDLQLSRGVPLAEDTAWADVIVSSVSSAAVESVFAGVPVFLQVRPSLTFTPDAQCFASERRFVRADEFLPNFKNCVALLDAGNPKATEPERETLVSLFGPSGEPRDMFDWLQEFMTPETKEAVR